MFAFGIVWPRLRIAIFIPDFFSWLPAMPAVPNLLQWLGDMFNWAFSTGFVGNIFLERYSTHNFLSAFILIFVLTLVQLLASPYEQRQDKANPRRGYDLLAKLKFWTKRDALKKIDKDGDGIELRDLLSASTQVGWSSIIKAIDGASFAVLQGLMIQARYAFSGFVFGRLPSTFTYMREDIAAVDAAAVFSPQEVSQLPLPKPRPAQPCGRLLMIQIFLSCGWVPPV